MIFFRQEHLIYLFFITLTTAILGGTPPTDMYMKLQMLYPHGTLIVDDPVEIQGTAISYTTDRIITNVTVDFPGSREYPLSNNISQRTEIRINKELNSTKLISSKKTVVWNQEGTDSPKLAITYIDKTGVHDVPATALDTIITIYPKSQLAQIITNKTYIALAIAAYVIGLLGTCLLIYDILWRKSESQSSNRDAMRIIRQTRIPK